MAIQFMLSTLDCGSEVMSSNSVGDKHLLTSKMTASESTLNEYSLFILGGSKGGEGGEMATSLICRFINDETRRC